MAKLQANIPVGENGLGVYFSLVNGLFNLSKKELEIVQEFIKLDDVQPCQKDHRKIVAKAVGLANAVTLNTHIGAITKKGVFVKNGRRYSYHPLFMVDKNIEKVEFNFV